MNDASSHTDTDERLQAIQALLRELDVAGDHFRASRHELMLGLRAVLAALETTKVPDNPLNSYTDWAMPYVTILRTLIDIQLMRRPGGTVDALNGPLAGATTDALGATREFLVHYLMRLDPDRAADERSALLAVLGILDQEIERRDSLTPADGKSQENETFTTPSNQVQWIEVEG